MDPPQAEDQEESEDFSDVSSDDHVPLQGIMNTPGLNQFIDEPDHDEEDYKEDKIPREATEFDKKDLAANYENHDEKAEAEQILDEREDFPTIYAEKLELIRWLQQQEGEDISVPDAETKQKMGNLSL